MKQIIPLLLIHALLVSSCNKTSVKTENFEDGTLKSEKTYEKTSEGEQLIKEVTYHPNGKKYMEGSFRDGLREGHWVSWFDNGTLWSEGDFKQGESHGLRSVYYPNGQLYYQGMYEMGKRKGVWLFYDETGEKIKEVDYDKESGNGE